MNINPKQIKLIKTIIGKMGIGDDLYREMLENRYGVNSCKQLTCSQSTEFVNYLKDQANQSGLHFPKASMNRHKHNNLADREGMASPKQLRKIEAMWFDYTRDTDEASRTKRLNAFLEHRFKVTNLKFLDKQTTSKVIYCIGKMLEQKPRRAC
ncbi:MAG: regulatory protein GemA [Cyanobacteriota bacterium]